MAQQNGKSIVLVSQWFPPEHAPIGYMLSELGADLARAGWEVTVVTGFPSHPTGVVFGGYRKRLLQRERRPGVNVLRVWHFTSPRRSVINRALTFVSFTLAAFVAVLLATRPALIFAVFQPLTVAIPLAAAARLKRARLVLNVQDLHPDAAVELGLIQNRCIVAALRRLETVGYRLADGVAVISEGFREHCVARGASAMWTRVIENWVDLEELAPAPRETALRSELGISEQDFVVLYAGTIGYMSGAEVMADVAWALQSDREIKLVFVGEGPVHDVLLAKAREERLENVFFLPFQARERLVEVQASSDVSVVTLRPGRGRVSVPSKVLAYMAAARPVVASVDEESETAALVQGAQCGIVVRAGDPEAIAGAIRNLKEEREWGRSLGRKGRAFLAQHLSRRAVTERYAEFFADVVARR